MSGFKPVQFEFEKKSAQLNMRLPETLLSAVKAKARERGIPYTRRDPGSARKDSGQIGRNCRHDTGGSPFSERPE